MRWVYNYSRNKGWPENECSIRTQLMCLYATSSKLQIKIKGPHSHQNQGVLDDESLGGYQKSKPQMSHRINK